MSKDLLYRSQPLSSLPFPTTTTQAHKHVPIPSFVNCTFDMLSIRLLYIVCIGNSGTCRTHPPKQTCPSSLSLIPHPEPKSVMRTSLMPTHQICPYYLQDHQKNNIYNPKSQLKRVRPPLLKHVKTYPSGLESQIREGSYGGSAWHCARSCWYTHVSHSTWCY